MNWNRQSAGHYTASVSCDEELDATGTMFLVLHVNVNHVENGTWEAFYRRGDDWAEPQKLTRIGFYRTMREAKRIAEAVIGDRRRGIKRMQAKTP